jgi:orotate phosphoribosyltransferase
MKLSRIQPNRIDARRRLFDIIKEVSFRRETIRLASGKISNYYLDMKPTLLNQEASTLLPGLVLEYLDVHADGIGGLEMGAVPLICPILIEAAKQDRQLFGFFVRKAVKDHGTQKLIESAEDVAGKDVIIIDDVTTTGKSAMQSVEALQQAGAKIKLVLSIVDREEGASDLYAAAGIPFTPLFRASQFFD